MNRLVQISHCTPGFLALSEDEQFQVLREFRQQAGITADWFYGCLRDVETGRPRVFVEQNETGAYTALLAEEH